ncbi:alpha/beta hydrolase [Neoroseomonas oryzicola]|uniref:Palmitoyl-protein thioesterase ABHD10, mitochondrial n=1 Tax=Neoroseomonas oryzicola TaxID=535904 RepID=A0A9X9WGK1_9PROT|nr:alpha/beta hydrolase [Neoroseomonas oryzicola]MBR0659461.1 alpha/beta hydrolase [Neoroseomonas oryzicola]NKE16392.1 alpha/beta hydrolase [Neoroseomonas oryzicola]
MKEEHGTIDRGDGVPLAWRRLSGRGPGVVFLGGFNSDMTGSKAEFLAGWCEARGTPFLRFDYSGHGASGGRFVDGTIGRWAEDAAHVVTALTEGPQVLVGSSMGGWIALLLARRVAIRALVGIAPAPDFTEDLMWAEFTPDQRAMIERDGVWHRPSAYGDPYPITRALIEDGRSHLLLRAPIALEAPVRILQGQQDPDVPWRHALRIAEAVTGGEVRVHLIKDGDHRLSRPQDLALLGETLAPLLREDGR